MTYGTIQVWFRQYYDSYSDERKPEHLLRLMGQDVSGYWRVAKKDSWLETETQYPFPTETSARAFIHRNAPDLHPRITFALVNPNGAVVK